MSGDARSIGRVQTQKRTLTGVALVIVAALVVQFGAGVAVLLFPSLGPLGIVSLRIAFAAVILLVIARPRLRGRTRADWMTVIAFGVVLATMNMAFYLSLELIPLGVAVTIEVLGPLILSVVMSRRVASWLWAALAFVGVLLLCGWDIGRLHLGGILLAALAGACWAGYILASARTGRRWENLDGLAIAMAVGAVVSLPFGIAQAGSAMLRLDLLALGLVVAVLSSVIPYACELVALRRLPESTFGVMMSTEPAIAAAVGFLVLHQTMTTVDLAGIALVIVATIGAVMMTSRSAQRAQAEAPPG